MDSIGTRRKYISWLSLNKHMTYTQYSRLAPATKDAIYAEYRKAQKS